MFRSDMSDGLTLCVISEFSAPKSGSSMSSGSPGWAQTRHMAAIQSDRRAAAYGPAVEPLCGLGRRDGDLCLLQHDVAVPGIRAHGVALAELALEDRQR